jgi:hypothetical protein
MRDSDIVDHALWNKLYSLFCRLPQEEQARVGRLYYDLRHGSQAVNGRGMRPELAMREALAWYGHVAETLVMEAGAEEYLEIMKSEETYNAL